MSGFLLHVWLFYMDTVMIRLSPGGGGGAYSKVDHQERWLIEKSGKYFEKELKNKLNKMALSKIRELNYMKLDIGVIMQKKNTLKNF